MLRAAGGYGQRLSSEPAERFAPGTVLLERYRIVGLLGRGGMGEVYRADDLTLGQTVALKFLKEALVNDLHVRERMLEEVRLAREVAHPSVCRVFDLGQVDDHLFLSMEYVDGEDMPPASGISNSADRNSKGRFPRGVREGASVGIAEERPLRRLLVVTKARIERPTSTDPPPKGRAAPCSSASSSKGRCWLRVCSR